MADTLTSNSNHLKSLSRHPHHALGTAALALACWLALPQTSQARDHGGQDNRFSSQRHTSGRSAYLALPSSGFTLTLGTGYAGRGYYYGPPNSGYYYQRSDVRYYATREAAPREYYGYRGDSTSAAVQQALARRGFYRGSIDGQILSLIHI